MSVLLPLEPGTLLPGVCYTSEQERLVDYAANLNAVLPGQAFYNFGSTKPSPENNIYPWFRTTDSRWYYYSGGWISLNPERSPSIRRIWMGSSGASLTTYDGGDANAPSDRSGPMWEIDTDFEARFPVGVGTFPNAGAVTVGGTGGEDQHVLTDAEVPATQVVPLDSTNNPTGDKTVQKSGDSFGFSFQNGDFSGSASGGRMTDILLRVNGGGGAHSNLPPYIGIYVIKPTSRLYYLVP